MIDYSNFTPYSALIGGVIIGLSSAMLLLFNGKICGISGITGNILVFKRHDTLWRTMFFAGLVCGGIVTFTLFPTTKAFVSDASTTVLICAGLLVGYGTRLGNGCTSGHGVCGMSRFSKRSILATCVFMISGMVTIYIVKHVVGG
ncbi:membrane protein [Candidatus Uabimicrobium amorphum]|uniref:Membrane protein n=2 Tax=Uabimicrobium amorphum TaxID=2596890 RepID=A0A5S9IUQ5_UABAM|nr:YeeE/YedE family protein [Candidatus Uabimicrobium amorphum]BBM87682.1 membrane protein [Candidatus Uabimicrobium amorphum]